MQKRAEVWAEKDARKLVKKYKKNLKSPIKNNSISSKYGLSLSHKKLKNYDEAFTILRELIKESPNNLVLEASLMELHLSSGNYFEAISLGRNHSRNT
ncbi:MAG: tetratricopeptide repeat protein [Gammaproteobacteria bacterium]